MYDLTTVLVANGNISLKANHVVYPFRLIRHNVKELHFSSHKDFN